MLRALVPAALVLALAGVSAASPAPVSGGSRGIVWEVHGKNGRAIILARIHVLDGSAYPLHPRLKAMFDRSDALAVELNLSDAKAMQHARQAFRQAGTYPSDDSLASHVTPETYAAVQGALSYLHVDAHELDHAKPWLADEVLIESVLRSVGFDPQYILEGPFVRMALDRKIDIVEMVPADEQIRRARSFPADLMDMRLRADAQDIANTGDTLLRKQEAWKLDDLQEWLADDSAIFLKHPEAKQAEDAWRREAGKAAADRLTDFLESGRTYFVIMSPEALIGPQGALELLKAKGYQVETK